MVVLKVKLLLIDWLQYQCPIEMSRHIYDHVRYNPYPNPDPIANPNPNPNLNRTTRLNPQQLRKLNRTIKGTNGRIQSRFWKTA